MEYVLVSGITGQDGPFLAQAVLAQGNAHQIVVGLHRRGSNHTFTALRELDVGGIPVMEHPRFSLEEFELTEFESVKRVVCKYRPTHFFNLAAQSHVHSSFDQPAYTMRVNTEGVLNVLEALRGHSPHTRFYQASSSEMYGSEPGSYNPATAPFRPVSPYALSKLGAHHLTRIYRDAYGLKTVCGILFNHESEYRGETFVTKKIIKGLVQAVFNDGPAVEVGNLNAVRDWGFAGDYVKAMIEMTNRLPEEAVAVCTGKNHTVRDLVNTTISLMPNPDTFAWIGQEGVGQELHCLSSIDGEPPKGHPVLRVVAKYHRPLELEKLQPTTVTTPDWAKPRTTFEELVERMYIYERRQLQKQGPHVVKELIPLDLPTSLGETDQQRS